MKLGGSNIYYQKIIFTKFYFKKFKLEVGVMNIYILSRFHFKILWRLVPQVFLSCN